MTARTTSVLLLGLASASLADFARCGSRSALDAATLPDASEPAFECAPGSAGDEVCNDVDDDCDGEVDEELAIEALGDPTIVRDTEGSAGDCSSCGWAFEPQLWATRGGVLALWRLSFDGADPRPNVYARSLTEDLVPAGSPFLALDLTATAIRLAPVGADRALVAFCRRVDGRDRTYSTLVSLDGSVAGKIVPRSPEDSECATFSSDIGAVWTGRRHLIFWTNRQWPFGVQLDIADASGRGVGERHLEAAGGIPVRAAAGHDQVALLSSRQQAPPGATITLHRFSVDGELLSEPALFESDEALGAALAATDFGWIIYAWGVNVSPFLLELSVEGELLRRADLVSDDGSKYALFGRPGGGFVSVETSPLSWHRGDGKIESTWTAPADDPLFDPVVAVNGGRTYLGYRRESIDSATNQVVVRQFGCRR